MDFTQSSTEKENFDVKKVFLDAETQGLGFSMPSCEQSLLPGRRVGKELSHITLLRGFLRSWYTETPIYRNCFCVARGTRGHLALLPLTLVDVEKGLAQLVGEQRLREVPEELFHHVRHVICGLVLVADVLGEVLVHLAQGVDSGFHT